MTSLSKSRCCPDGSSSTERPAHTLWIKSSVTGSLAWVTIQEPSGLAEHQGRGVVDDPEAGGLIPVFQQVGPGQGEDSFTSCLPDPKDPGSIDHRFVSVMFEDRSGDFWIRATDLAEACLAVVWNIVHDHGAHIDVSSAPGGTTFAIYFPAVRTNVEVVAEFLPKQVYFGQGQCILVVDDEEAQRDVISQMPESLGTKS